MNSIVNRKQKPWNNYIAIVLRYQISFGVNIANLFIIFNGCVFRIASALIFITHAGTAQCTLCADCAFCFACNSSGSLAASQFIGRRYRVVNMHILDITISTAQ